jgi:hypothetical protein
MTDKREKPLFLDMDPDEALARFIQTDPVELKRRLETKKPPPKRGQGVDTRAGPKPKPSG